MALRVRHPTRFRPRAAYRTVRVPAMRKIWIVFATVALLFSACDSGGETSTSAGDDVTDDSTDAPTDGDGGDSDDQDGEDDGTTDDGDDAASDADDQAKLDAALDAVEDDATQRGYATERSPADTDEDDEDDLEFTSAECQEADEVFNRLDEEYPETATSESLEANRGEFTAPDSEVEQISIELSSFESADAVDQAFAALESVPLADCMREAFAGESDDEVSIEIDSVEVVDGDRGDRELILEIRATFSGGGMSFPAELRFHFIAVDRYTAFVFAFAFNGAPSADAGALADAAVNALQ